MEIVKRMARNSFLVLSLIIPVAAGMGLNFGIVLGALAGQIALILSTHWEWSGIGGLVLTALLATPPGRSVRILGRHAAEQGQGQGNDQRAWSWASSQTVSTSSFSLFLVGTLIPFDNPRLRISTQPWPAEYH